VIADRTLNRDDLPFPLDRPLTGQDLLQVFPGILGPMWTQAAKAVRPGVGTVTAIGTGPATVTVTIGSITKVCRYFRTYVPIVGDTVFLLHNAAQAIVLGPLA
jgi:hypothetical protein